MGESVFIFIAEIFVKVCYKIGINSLNYASFHYMHEPKQPKSLDKIKKQR